MFNISEQLQSFKTIAAVAGSSLLIACSGGGGTSDQASSPAEVETQMTTIEGSAIKGVISNGLVQAYRVVDNGGVLEIDETALTAAVRTDAQGNFQLSLDERFNNDSVVIEITADGQTRMTCDVTSGCGTDDSGSAIQFGDQFALDSSFAMTGVVTGVTSGQRLQAYVNPMTHMAVAYANAQISGLTSSNINSALRAVEDLLDLDNGALDQNAADITALSNSSVPTKAELELGVMAASFLGLVNTPDWDGIEEVLLHIEERMANSGQLASVNMGALRDVTLDDLFNGAMTIANDLVSANPEAEYVQVMTQVADETAVAYSEVTESGNQVDPVTITSQPQSVDVDEGGNVTLSVGANGGGTLSFQWRKDGVAIDGAIGSSYTISAAALNDAGLYDVIVSNSVGSVASNSALLAVNEVTPSLGTIALSWDIPTQREDGSALELFEIDGYVIVYGTESGQLTNQINIVGAGETTASIADLPPATYYFAIATIDSDGRQGNYSSEISQTIM
ncbi:MAG: immunoglobulin domain-containing protein [Oleiphilaceae bacterium]|nr:immunoglobulin domain-containing protein [Oleiphilaceae bacterium]